MSGFSVAFRYASALYQVAAGKALLREVAGDLLTMEKIFTQAPPIRGYCLREHGDHTAEQLFVATAFLPYVGRLTGDTLKTAVRNGRLSTLPFLPEAFRTVQENESGITRVVLECAREPDAGLRADIERKIARRIGGKIALTTTVRPALLGGMRILWNNRILDLSVSGRLKKMRALLKAG